MIEVRSISAAYGPHPALQDVSLNVNKGEIVVILGANGAGKSTLLRAISGICEGEVSGDISLSGQSLLGRSSDEIVERGVALVPEGRGIFGDLTVKENLMLGAYSKRARGDEQQSLERVMRLFPKLGEREGQIARTMSGGEQQMVAIGRAMMSAPEILMLDEPSLGLSPLLCKELFQNLKEVKKIGIGVLLVEQNAKQSLAIADRGYLLENTRIVHEDSAEKLSTDPAVQKAYLGAGAKAAPKPVSAPLAEKAVPDKPVVSVARAQPRRTAEQQVGLSIDEMVEGATQTSATTKPAPQPRTIAASPDKVESVLRDMENAARVARERAQDAVQRRTDVPSTAKEMSPSQTADDAKPPVIEVYRRPRVEVYRRRPDGAFKRD